MASVVCGPDKDFVQGLRAWKLLGEDDYNKASAYRQAYPQRGAKELTEFLVGQTILTRFQADAVLRGEGASLVLSQFVLTDVLGSGSMGTVYKARSSKHEGLFALKVVPRRNVVSLTAVAEKVTALRDIRHPRVSALVHLGAAGDRVYLAWPYLEGGEKLEALIAHQGKLSSRQAVQVGLQIASGLQPYDEHGLFHGLLKPSDVLIGTDRRVRILDFGVGFLLACERGKSLLDTMTNTKALARGVDCASPEALADPLDRTPAGDRYSLGCVLYYCLTGQFPFPDKNPVKKMLGHQFEEPRPLRELNPEVTPKLTAVVGRLLRKAPAERFENTGELVRALQTLAGAKPTPPRPALVRPPAAAPAERPDEGEAAQRWPLVATGVAGGAFAGAALGWLLTRLL
jgi:serine/threonine protein kinase